MFNFFNSAKFHAANAVDKTAIKGYGAGYSACHGIARAAIAGMKACSEGKKRHQEALDARHKAWMALQADLDDDHQQPAEPKATPQQQKAEPQPQEPVVTMADGQPFDIMKGTIISNDDDDDAKNDDEDDEDDEEIDLSNAKF